MATRQPQKPIAHNTKGKSRNTGLTIAIVLVLLTGFSLIATYFRQFLVAGIILLLIFGEYQLYALYYFNTPKFKAVKNRIASHIHDCNELNVHIEELKNTKLVATQIPQGTVRSAETGQYHMARPSRSNAFNDNYVYKCSQAVLDKARDKPFDYICKYFGIQHNEKTLEAFETLLNNFEAAEDGKQSLLTERQKIFDNIQQDIPWLIKHISRKRLEKNLGFQPVTLAEITFPQYTFVYVSAGGYVSERVDIIMDIEQLNEFIEYLGAKIKFSKTKAKQRSLMTSRLREHIKARDHYECQMCGISTRDEPHLLLEIDHILPIAKGGLTTEDNLQTLCWKCNRHKGART